MPKQSDETQKNKELDIHEHIADDVPDLMPDAFDIKIFITNQHNWAGEKLKEELPALCREIMDLLTSRGFVGMQVQSGAYFKAEDKDGIVPDAVSRGKKVGGFDA